MATKEEQSFLTIYRSLVKRKRAISRTLIEAGLIVTFKYSGTNVHTVNPIVFVLNPKYQGLLHGIALEHLALKDFRVFYELIRRQREAKKEYLVKLRLPLLPVRLTTNPKTFYYNKVKPLIGTDNVYRTYDVKYISTVQAYELDFEKFNLPEDVVEAGKQLDEQNNKR